VREFHRRGAIKIHGEPYHGIPGPERWTVRKIAEKGSLQGAIRLGNNRADIGGHSEEIDRPKLSGRKNVQLDLDVVNLSGRVKL
jgi:hypothetical protein